ncbi:VanZ family protein [Sporosarcina sp. Marseille-Q4063]|uniref:VanZ family protein n=1 Tax=Sporosarcina sp. Marseille-Q4063 TaxID=2810514 RepID=UPI001BAE97D0|nr:VanZ family protein [Sporosarcina sp. Marseille-Q4063]QUW22768.1 VanZ family protein [Sporosarcina sp. Marseille-Q4063]
MTAILGYISEMLPYMIIAMPGIIIYRYIYNKIRKFDKFNLPHEVGVVIFCLFMIALFSQTIMTRFYTGPVVTRSFSNINLVPFRVFLDNYYAITELNYWQPFIINFLGNICIFMPIGFLVPLLWGKFNRFWKAALIGLATSLFIEVTQLSQVRSSDIDDLWLNTLGGILGYGFYYILNKKHPRLTKKFKR